MTQEAQGPGGPHKRRWRNFLLDPRFQLKYSGFLVAIAVVLSVSLGLILWTTSRKVIAQSHEAVHQGNQVVARGREVLRESQKVNDVVRMNIEKDPVYADNPALLEAFRQDAKKQDQRMADQQAALESQSRALQQQSARIADQQRTMFISLCVILTLLVLGIGLAGIVVTHKIAGPIFKMKRQIRELGSGELRLPAPLRKGDELQEFFAAFAETVAALRGQQEARRDKLRAAVAALEPKLGEEELASLRGLIEELDASLK